MGKIRISTFILLIFLSPSTYASTNWVIHHSDENIHIWTIGGGEFQFQHEKANLIAFMGKVLAAHLGYSQPINFYFDYQDFDEKKPEYFLSFSAFEQAPQLLGLDTPWVQNSPELHLIVEAYRFNAPEILKILEFGIREQEYLVQEEALFTFVRYNKSISISCLRNEALDIVLQGPNSILLEEILECKIEVTGSGIRDLSPDCYFHQNRFEFYKSGSNWEEKPFLIVPELYQWLNDTKGNSVVFEDHNRFFIICPNKRNAVSGPFNLTDSRGLHSPGKAWQDSNGYLVIGDYWEDEENDLFRHRWFWFSPETGRYRCELRNVGDDFELQNDFSQLIALYDPFGRK